MSASRHTYAVAIKRTSITTNDWDGRPFGAAVSIIFDNTQPAVFGSHKKALHYCDIMNRCYKG